MGASRPRGLHLSSVPSLPDHAGERNWEPRGSGPQQLPKPSITLNVALSKTVLTLNCRLVPVVLTLIDSSDVEQLARGTPMSVIAQQSVARICREAFEQGALLSMRDIGLLVWRKNGTISAIRKQLEADQKTTLPHVGTIQDFGTCISHKAAIIRKVIYEGKDPRRAADETKHSQHAVDRYLKDFHRVRTCYEHMPDIEFVTRTTGLSKHLVEQYIGIIKEHENSNAKTA